MASYTNQTLIGNWSEDRLDKDKALVDARFLRTATMSKPPIKMGPDDPNMFRTVSKEYTKPPRPRPDTTVSMCTIQTIGYTLDHPTALSMPHHTDAHDERQLYTTHNTVYGGPHSADERTRTAPLDKSAVFGSGVDAPRAGINGWDRRQKAPERSIDRAVGERLNVGTDVDPKSHTFVQRSWRASSESAMYGTRSVEKYGDWSENVPGHGIKGLGVVSNKQPEVQNNALRRTNDALHIEQGIWS